VTLYDVVYDQTAKVSDPSLAVTDTSPVSFTRDIYPLLRRVSRLHWVSGVAARPEGHAQNGMNDFASRVTLLSSKGPDAAAERNRIFGALRNPATGVGKMPKLPEKTNKNVRGPFVPQTQYKRMQRWAQGSFDADWPGAEPKPVPLDRLPASEQPHALDRAALEACVGGPFFPGIEVSGMMLDATTYDPKRPFRINAQIDPGTLTARMAVPWQSDFHDCGKEGSADWWPGQRPTHVLGAGRTRAGDWMPDQWEREDMVTQWMRLGFIVEDASGGDARYVEDERNVDV
jgi:hypothetical protein